MAVIDNDITSGYTVISALALLQNFNNLKKLLDL